jgi:hypothetical protein
MAMNPFESLFRLLLPRRAAAPPEAPSPSRRFRGEDKSLLRLTSMPGGRDMEVARDGTRLALVRPPEGAMVLEVLPLRDADGAEVLVAALYDLEERRGLLARWEAASGDEDPTEGDTLFEGPPESVLWRLAERDGAVYATDTRHRVLYRVSLDGGAEAVTDGERSFPAPERAAG